MKEKEQEIIENFRKRFKELTGKDLAAEVINPFQHGCEYSNTGVQAILAYTKMSPQQLFSSRRPNYLVIPRRILFNMIKYFFFTKEDLIEYLKTEWKYDRDRTTIYNDLFFEAHFNHWRLFRMVFLEFRRFLIHWSKDDTYRMDNTLIDRLKISNHYYKSQWMYEENESSLKLLQPLNSMEIEELPSSPLEQANPGSLLNESSDLLKSIRQEDSSTPATTPDSEMLTSQQNSKSGMPQIW